MSTRPGPVLVPLGPVGGPERPPGASATGGSAAPGPWRWALAGRALDLHVLDLGLACCAVELVAATAPPAASGRLGVRTSGDPDAAAAAAPVVPSVLVVAGTVTDALAPHVAAVHRSLAPDYVLSMGSCSNTGGPYWDSYSVTKGVDQLLPVDVYVPGCPPPPGALLDALGALADRIRPP